MMYHSHPLRTSPNPDHDEDEDGDYKLALQLSAQLNDASATTQNESDADAELALALQLEFDNEMKDEPGPSARRPSATWADIQSSWELHDTYLAEYQRETCSTVIPGEFSGFMASMRSWKCNCGEVLLRSELDVTQLVQSWIDGKENLSSWNKCRNCSTSSCIGCIPEPYAKQSTLTAQNKQISWCCSGGRLFLIWILLCQFDKHFCAARTKEAAKTKQMSLAGGKSKKKSRDSGVGFGGSHRHSFSHMPSGMGYGSELLDFEELDSYLGFPKPFFRGKGKTLNLKAGPSEDGIIKAQGAQNTEDKFNAMILEFLKGLLPALDRDSSFDIDPPEVVTDLLLKSKILSYCAELLRNDSLEDATKRYKLYNALLTFLQTLGMHTMADRTLFSERLVQPEAVSLLTLTFGCTTETSKETASSLAIGLRNLATQSELVLRSAKSNEKDFNTEEGQNMLLLCRQISDLSQYILANTGAPTENNAQVSASLVISELPDEQILTIHAYGSSAKSLNFSPPGRFKRLITEITKLKTGLPPGIFVRYCENRPDVLKVVIVGPMGTPYENGLFEFDFFCDQNFPNKPPLVLFKGTGGGRVSINPNLYHDGKVCLSLLGTWQGEPWKPGESTLLQVVLSLQAMIFCEEPWYNEPGRESSYRKGSSSSPSIAYNKDIRQHTVDHAILSWIDQSPPLWKEVMDYHFKTNANTILQRVEEWAQNESAIQKTRQDRPESFPLGWADMGITMPVSMQKTDMSSRFPRLQAALQKYGATYTIKKVAQTSDSQPRAPVASMPRPASLYSLQSSSMIPPPVEPTPFYGQPPPYSFMQLQSNPALSPPAGALSLFGQTTSSIPTQSPPPLMNSGGQGRGELGGIGRALGSGHGQPDKDAMHAALNNHRSKLFGIHGPRKKYVTRSSVASQTNPTVTGSRAHNEPSSSSPANTPARSNSRAGRTLNAHIASSKGRQ